MEPTSQYPSSDGNNTKQDERRRGAQPSKSRAQESPHRKSKPPARNTLPSQTAFHVEHEHEHSPTSGKDNGAVSIPNPSMPRGQGPAFRPPRAGDVRRARATSTPASPTPRIDSSTASSIQQPSLGTAVEEATHMKGRNLTRTHARPDQVSSISSPTINQGRPSATTYSQESSKYTLMSTISGNSASGNTNMTNNIIYKLPGQNSECLQYLKITNPVSDKTSFKDRHRPVYENLLQKVREHPNYDCWKRDDETRLLWIYCHGSETMDFEAWDQKTIVAVAVANELEDSLMVPTNISNNQGALSYIFCGKSIHPKLNTPAAMLRGLMWLLCLKESSTVRSEESLAARLEERYYKEGMSLFEDQNATIALSDIFFKWLKDTNVSTVYLLVGAIDECYGEERRDTMRILDLITTRCKALANVKWLITSDYDDSIIKARLKTHDRSFKIIHLNKRRTAGRRKRNKKKALDNDTEGTNPGIEGGGREGGQVKGEHLDKGKREAGDSITEGSVAVFLNNVANEDKDEEAEESDGEERANAERGQEIKKVQDEKKPRLIQRVQTPPLQLNSEERRPDLQQGRVSKPSNSNVPDGSAQRRGCCVVQ